MPKNYTIEEQLEQLIIQKNALEDILKDKGVEVNDDETFNSLISKVNELETESLGVYSLPITTFTSDVTNQTVDFNWILPVDDARSGVVICYSDVEVPQEVGDNIWYDSETLSGTTTTSLNSVFPTGGTWYTTIFTYTMINNKRVYTKGPSLTFDCIPKGLEIFKASGTFTVPKGTNSVDIFLVGGGAGGNSAQRVLSVDDGFYYNGGDGGRGGDVYTKYGVAVTPFDTIEVVVGAGGAGAETENGYYEQAIGSAGESSKFGSYSSSFGVCRSGGVGAIYHTSKSSQRQDGTAGINGVYAFGDSTIDGIKYGASGGGGGAAQTYKSGKSGGATGGGEGGNMNWDGSNGATNSGGGGGGAGAGSDNDTQGGHGGSGIVIVRWGY